MTDEAIIAMQRRVWSSGDYPSVAQHLLPISVALVERAAPSAGHHVLDVATGDGNTAVLAAQRGATVAGIDISPVQVDRARARLASEGLTADLREANAEDLPFGDASFDAVLSCMGVIFAPDHERAIGEMARVCRPGGTVAITAWSGGGWSLRLWQALADVLPPPPAGAPRTEEWGDPDQARERFAGAGMAAEVTSHDFSWDFPSTDAAIDLFTRAAGPFVTLMELAGSLGVTERVIEAMRASMEAANVARDGSLSMPAPYLLAAASAPG